MTVQNPDWRVIFWFLNSQVHLPTVAAPESWPTFLIYNQEGVSSALCGGVYVNSHVAEIRTFNAP
jgi:hypothetical protein